MTNPETTSVPPVDKLPLAAWSFLGGQPVTAALGGLQDESAPLRAIAVAVGVLGGLVGAEGAGATMDL